MGSADVSNPKGRGDGSTWTTWATENVSIAQYVAAQSAMLFRDTATSTIKYVTDEVASKLPNREAIPTSKQTTQTDGPSVEQRKSAPQLLVDSGMGFKDTIVKRIGYSADKETSKDIAIEDSANVQDVVARFSSTAITRNPELEKKSRRESLIDTGLGLKDGIATRFGYGPDPHSPEAARAAVMTERTRDLAENWRQSTVSAITPGDGDKELARNITDFLHITARKPQK